MGRTSRAAVARGRPLFIVALVLAVAVAVGVGAAPAAAWSDYVHGGASCNSCHPNGTGAPGTNDACQSCHTGFLLHPGDNCWTCHKPGSAPPTTQAGCTGVCHEWSAADTYGTTTTPHGATPHNGATLRTCVTCHPVSVSVTNPGQSAHHSGEAAPEAPTCTTCHAAVPVDSAPAPHTPFVSSVTDCTTCHKGMTPHLASSAIVKPTLTIAATAVGVTGEATVSGTLKNGATGLGTVHVFLQVKTPTAADFSPLTEVDTAADGSFTFTVTGATAGAVYRAVSEGVTGPPVIMPTIASTERATATLTLKLSATAIKLGKSVTAKGILKPVSLAGTKVKITVQRKVGTKWVKVKVVSRLTSPTGAYSWKFKPAKRGTYRFRTSLAATTLHTAAKTPFRALKVK